jgi:hypothetical protein
MVKDRVDAIEALHNAGEDDLHFRFIGTSRGHQFVLNIQFAAMQEQSSRGLLDHGFMIAQILGVVVRFVGNRPDSGPH